MYIREESDKKKVHVINAQSGKKRSKKKGKRKGFGRKKNPDFLLLQYFTNRTTYR